MIKKDLNSSVDSVMREEKILSLEEVINIKLIKIGHHLSTGTLPVNLVKNLKLDHLLNSLQRSHSYNTCYKNDLKLPNAKVKTYRNSFLYKSILQFNKLPQQLKNITNLQTITKNCKAELFGK